MRSIIIISLICMASVSSDIYGQSLDQNKMNKDLEVSENVLSSLMEKSTSNRFLWRFGDNIDAKYQSGYGVIFTIQNNFPIVMYGQSRSSDAYSIASSNVVIAGSKDKSEASAASDNKGIKLKEIARDFIMDYHNLIRQLKPSDKIMVKTAIRKDRWESPMIFSTTGKKYDNNLFSIEATVSDLAAFSDGKITRMEMMKKFVEKDISVGNESEPEIEVFSAAFGRLYQSDLADSYYMTGYPWHERTEGFGVTYYMKFYSSTQINELYNLPTFKKSNLELAERNSIVETAYPEFKEGLKENMLDYGHLLKNLKSSEYLIFNIRLTECKNCDMPQEIELKVKKSIIDQYRNGQLNLKDAMKAIDENIIDS